MLTCTLFEEATAMLDQSHIEAFLQSGTLFGGRSASEGPELQCSCVQAPAIQKGARASPVQDTQHHVLHLCRCAYIHTYLCYSNKK